MLKQIDNKIKDLIAKAPKTSGIYHFLSENGDSLYIGKAKNLRKRLITYAKPKHLQPRILSMVLRARNIEITVTTSELEALLLEHNLIKKFAPKYNILLRDDKTFAAIAIDKKHKFGGIKKYRGTKDGKAYYFGPFPSGGDVNRVIDVVKKVFLLRSCSDQEFKSRKKPCMEYQIKRCSAPCVGLVSHDDYQKTILLAVDFLRGKSTRILQKLNDEMQKFSDAQNYEQAALARDRVRSLKSIQEKQNINLANTIDKDVICLAEKDSQYCVYISFYRGGNNYGAKPYFYSVQDELTKAEFLQNFLAQFYLSNEVAKNIILNHEISEPELMQEFLQKNAGTKINLHIPKKGVQMALIKDQEHLALEVLTQKISNNLNNANLIDELQNLLHIKNKINKIEVYDNSHTGGQNAVGALICAGREGFIKSHYRKFNIRFEQKNHDDTAMLKEVLSRRFRDFNSQNETNPDLVIIDGGLTQLSAAHEIWTQLKINIPFMCMSKGKKRNAGEEYFHQIGKESFTLPKNHPLMHYLQRLRDEAHRFAIMTHRKKRQKALLTII